MKNLKIDINVIVYSLILIACLVGFQSLCVAQQEKSIDDQVKEISYLLMCPVCQGQSIAESNSNLAQDMREIIRKQLEEGKTKEEIISYFVSSYGESILATPPPKGINWVLWLLPGVAIIIAGIGITLYLFRAQKDDKEENVEAETNPAQTNDEYMNRVEEELKKSD